MKTYSKEELKAIAMDMLKQYPKVQKVHVTSDGQCFSDENEHAAKTYAQKNRYGKELGISVFTRDEAMGALENADETGSENKRPTAKELERQIKEATTIESVTAILEAEKAAENRVTVAKAAEKRVAELTKTNE